MPQRYTRRVAVGIPLPSFLDSTILERALRGARRPGAQRALHQDGVEPAAELEADVLERADHAKPGRAVQLDRGGLSRVSDHRDHLPKSARFARLDQAPDQGAPDAAAMKLRGDIDRVLDRPAVGWPRA